jgi:hypothetical protein
MRAVTSRASTFQLIAARGEGLQRAFERVGVPAWFLIIDVIWVAKPLVLGIDARHYQRAASTWLAGGDPWSVTELGVPFAAGPHTLLLYAPTSVIPLQASFVFWMALGVAVSVWTVRRLGLPLWYVGFPPLFHAIWNGNPQTLMLALLVLGQPLASAGAVLVKLYAILPLLFRPRHLLVAVLVLVVTLPILPWQQYIADQAGVAHHLSHAWNGSAWRFPILLLPPTLVGLWILRRKGAEWLSIPAVWPATQYYYVSSVLPLLPGRPMLAAILAAPVVLVAPAVVIGLAIREVLARRNAPES